MSNLQKWGDYDLDTARDEQQSLDAEGGADFMKLSVGRNIVRIMPPAAGQRSPFRVTHQHYMDTPNGRFVFTCPRVEAKRRCPVCAKAERLRRSGNPADREEAYDMLPKRRVFCNVIDRSEPERGPRVLAFGKKIHEALVKLRQDEDAGGDFTHPVDGIDVIIEREGTGKTDTSYSVNLARRSSPLADDATVVDEWASSMHNLDQFARMPSDEEIIARLRGEDPPARTEDPPAKPAASRSGGGGAKRSAQADVADAEFDDAGQGDDEGW